MAKDSSMFTVTCALMAEDGLRLDKDNGSRLLTLLVIVSNRVLIMRTFFVMFVAL